MEEESKFPRVFETCPHCGSEETTAVEAWKETHHGEIKKGQVLMQSSFPVALEDGGGLLKPTMPALVEQQQTCFNCGLVRVKKSEIVQLPTPTAPGPSR